MIRASHAHLEVYADITLSINSRGALQAVVLYLLKIFYMAMLSSLLQTIRYHLLRCRHPQLADFISSGIGIEARHARCSSQWRHHLNLTRNFQATAIERHAPQSVLILGAGRLLDVPTEMLCRSVREV